MNATALYVYFNVPAIDMLIRSQTQRAQLTHHELARTLCRAWREGIATRKWGMRNKNRSFNTFSTCDNDKGIDTLAPFYA